MRDDFFGFHVNTLYELFVYGARSLFALESKQHVSCTRQNYAGSSNALLSVSYLRTTRTGMDENDGSEKILFFIVLLNGCIQVL